MKKIFKSILCIILIFSLVFSPVMTFRSYGVGGDLLVSGGGLTAASSSGPVGVFIYAVIVALGFSVYIDNQASTAGMTSTDYLYSKFDEWCQGRALDTATQSLQLAKQMKVDSVGKLIVNSAGISIIKEFINHLFGSSGDIVESKTELNSLNFDNIQLRAIKPILKPDDLKSDYNHNNALSGTISNLYYRKDYKWYNYISSENINNVAYFFVMRQSNYNTRGYLYCLSHTTNNLYNTGYNSISGLGLVSDNVNGYKFYKSSGYLTINDTYEYYVPVIDYDSSIDALDEFSKKLEYIDKSGIYGDKENAVNTDVYNDIQNIDDTQSLVIDYGLGTAVGQVTDQQVVINVEDWIHAVSDGIVSNNVKIDGIPIDDYIQSYIDKAISIQKVEAETVTGTNVIDQTITGDTDTDTDNDTDIDVDKPLPALGQYKVDLTELFPFCIPFDIYKFIRVLNASPEAPHFTYKFAYKSDKGIQYKDVEIDLSKFNTVASVVRVAEFLAFCLGLAFITRNIIRG